MQRRVTWNLTEWPRVRDLQESLVWVRNRLTVPDPVVTFSEAEAGFGVILVQEPPLLPH